MNTQRLLGFLVILVIIASLFNVTTSSLSATSKWWDKFGEPQYGGMLTRRTTSGAIANINADPWTFVMGVDLRIWNEKLAVPDWTVDRSVYPFTVGWTPQEYLAGQLAETWEQTDPQTVVVTLRQGIHWRNIPPVNGRELTAEDVKYNYDRMLGTGSGFTDPNPWYAGGLLSVESVVARDKYTVEFKFKEPSTLAVDTLYTNSNFGIASPEWLKQYGSTALVGGPPKGPPGGPPKGPPKGADSTVSKVDWSTVAGTGAWILTEFVPGVSVTFSRNPDYWGHDERYPENQIPYLDTFRSIAIDDMTTTLAALRTAKIDMLTEFQGPTLQQAKSAVEANPDLQLAYWPQNGTSLGTRCDKKPFTDIRVRKALQMSIDLKTIARSYYSGTVEDTPVGLINPLLSEWCNPYDQWPADLKEEYTYNPTKAKELLAEAGYPNGFKTSMIVGNVFDLELCQVLKAMLMDIGIDMDLQVMDMVAFNSVQTTGKFDQISYSRMTGLTSGPSSFQSLTTGYPRNYMYNNDATYDEMYKKMMTTVSLDEAKSLAKEMDFYILRQHWMTTVLPISNPLLWQPWVKGFSGEFTESDLEGFWYSRFWLDKDVKKSMEK